MDSVKVNLEKITQIPQNEFKEHFREWMEQDDVARCLQAKLRKDLILNFNKTTLGRKLIAQSAASNRLNLSPLVLALNTLVAEFLYAQNCHFTLSVFCTEVPHRHTLPDFESVRHFRFSEAELFEIFDALSSNWPCPAKDDISKQYASEKSPSLLFAVLKCLLHRPIEKSPDDAGPAAPEAGNKSKSDKKNSLDNQNLQHLNKFLKVFLKKVQKMSASMEAIQAQNVGQHAERKLISLRKLDKLHRSMNKISENLRRMSATKVKTRSLTSIVSAINSMTKQFGRCALGFHAASKQMLVERKKTEAAPAPAPAEKSYSEWMREMKTTSNGKKFLEKVEQSLHKALLRERTKMEEDFQNRLHIQKNILKVKYKQKLAEEVAKITAREKTDAIPQMTNTLEKRLKEFLLKTKKIHEEASAKCADPKTNSQADTVNVFRPPSCDKETQTSFSDKSKLFLSSLDAPTDRNREHDGRQVDTIVLAAKQRVQQLELESNQLDRSIREFLKKQKSDKKVIRESAASILSTYETERSILEKRCAEFCPPIAKASNTSKLFTIIDTSSPENYSKAELNINLDEPIVQLTFRNAFRLAHDQILDKNKVPPRLLTESNANVVRRHFSSVLAVSDKDEGDVDSPPSPPCGGASKVTVARSSRLETSDAEISLYTAKPPEKGDSNVSPAGIHKVKRQAIETMDNGIPLKSSEHQVNGNHDEEVESPVKQIINDNGDGDARELIGDDEKYAELSAMVMEDERDENELTPRAVSSSLYSFRYFDLATGELKLPKDFRK